MQMTRIISATLKHGNPCVTLVRSMDNLVRVRVLDITPKEFIDGMRLWRAGVVIQNAFPNASADDREFLITGITPEEWKEMFPESENE